MSSPELTRRGALGGLLAVGLSGCDVGTTDADPPRPTPRSEPDAVPEPTEDPDLALVDDVRDDLAAALSFVTAARRGRRGLARELDELSRLHLAHLRELPGGRDQAPSPRVRGDAARVRARVRALESRLQGTLADAAVRAESGPLAALLASMSAAVAQQLAVPSRGPR